MCSYFSKFSTVAMHKQEEDSTVLPQKDFMFEQTNLNDQNFSNQAYKTSWVLFIFKYNRNTLLLLFIATFYKKKLNGLKMSRCYRNNFIFCRSFIHLLNVIIKIIRTFFYEVWEKFTSIMEKQQFWLRLVFVICFKYKVNMGQNRKSH